MPTSGMIGRTYLERGLPVTVLLRWSGPGPRNVLIQRHDGSQVVRPFRGLRLSGGEQAILSALIDAYPHGIDRDALSDATGYKRSSRDTYLQRLRARQLVTTDGEPRAADVLFASA